MSLSKRSLLVLALMFNTGSALADIECSRVDESDDWRITLNSNSTMGSFFDNDHEIAMGLKEHFVYESMPPQPVYVLRGKDGSGYPDDFEFNEYKMTGTLYLGVKSGKPSKKGIEFACKKVKKSYMDWNAVAKALDDSSSNGGSTRY